MWLIESVVAKRFAFGKHIYIFSQLGAMNAATGFLHTLYFFQIFFNLATGMIKLTMYVTLLTYPSDSLWELLTGLIILLDWPSIVGYFQSRS